MGSQRSTKTRCRARARLPLGCRQDLLHRGSDPLSFRTQEDRTAAGDLLKHALIIEEAHHILSQIKEHHEGAETIMQTSLRQIREFGEAVVVIDQEPTKLSNSIKANTYTKIVFNLGIGKDKEEIARCLGLDREETRYIDYLNVGEAIVVLKRPGASPHSIFLRPGRAPRRPS